MAGAGTLSGVTAAGSPSSSRTPTLSIGTRYANSFEAGGEPGAVGENWLLRQGDESRSERLLDKCTVRLRQGDVARMLTPGGSGWGPPSADA